MRIFSRIVAFWQFFKICDSSKCNGQSQFCWKCTFYVMTDLFQNNRQIKAWYYRIDLINPLRFYNGLWWIAPLEAVYLTNYEKLKKREIILKWPLFKSLLIHYFSGDQNVNKESSRNKLIQSHFRILCLNFFMSAIFQFLTILGPFFGEVLTGIDS